MDIDKEREAFEKWRTDGEAWGNELIVKDKFGSYMNISTWSMWNAWKARSSLGDKE